MTPKAASYLFSAHVLVSFDFGTFPVLEFIVEKKNRKFYGFETGNEMKFQTHCSFIVFVVGFLMI